MAIGLIGWGRFPVTDSNGVTSRATVPAPPTDKNALWLADYIRENAASIGSSFSFFQWPPFSKAQGGDGAGCDGYGVFDRYDLGTKNQQGSIPTRYGTLESLLSAIAALNAHGTQSYGDLVLHQMMGENGGPGIFRYLGADGKTQNGRGATTPGWFRGGTGNNDPIPPFCNEDDVAGGIATDFSFGRELSYQHSNPAGVSLQAAKDFVQWLTKRTGVVGYRYDDVKGAWAQAVQQIMAAVPNVQFYSEYFDGNPATLNWWATSWPMNGRSAVEDFMLHFRIQAACNGFDATQFSADGNGYWQWNSGLAIPFVDNPDTDTSPGQQVIFNKGIAYAYMLNLPTRMALVYGKDYFPSSVWPGAYGLKPIIDNIAWVSNMFAFGAFEERWVDRDVYAYTRDGAGGVVGWSGGLLVAVNFNTLSPRTVSHGTTFGPNRHLHDYSGHIGDVWTDGAGNVTYTIPSNAYSGGQSFVLLAPAGVNSPFEKPTLAITHSFLGDPSLDVLPVKNGMVNLPQRIHASKGTHIQARLDLNRNGVSESAGVQIEIISPSNSVVASATTGIGATATASGTTDVDGWYTIRLIGSFLPPAGATFELDVTYTGLAA